EFRKGLSFEFRAFGAVIDHAAVEIHFHLVAVFDSPACLSALDDGKSDVDGVSVKNPGKCLRDHTAYAGRLDGDGRMLSGGTAAEVLVGYDDVAFVHLMHEILVDVLHTVCRHFCGICGIQISRRDDHICVHLISVFEYSAFCLHCSIPPSTPSSSGAEIFPVTALAAATAGLAR